jgi:hypothetical protein
MPAEPRDGNGQSERQARVERLITSIHKSCSQLQGTVMGPAVIHYVKLHHGKVGECI